MPLISQLQEICAPIQAEVDLPQIVVVGGQSSGKSSVLEALVRRDFLPRGSGIVTRRPLVLQLHRTSPGSGGGGEGASEFGVFAHAPTRRFTSFDEIRTEIKRETDRLSGQNKGISAEPIILAVHSPHVLPLTLVDTPGVTRVPVGDQPPDIEQRVRKLVHSYIVKPNALILAVHAANQDLATSDALTLAREVDPQGRRTLGVLTKLDLMDAGESAVDMLLGRAVPLRLGYVGLVNRSQADVTSKVSVERGIESEQRFFASRPEYGALASACGAAVLARRCSVLLAAHIRRSLPGLADQLAELRSKTTDELRSFGSAPVAGAEGRRLYLLQSLSAIGKAYGDAIDGKRGNMSTKELNGGARIRYVFHEQLRSRLAVVPLTLNTTDIRTALRNASGVGSSAFLHEAAFETLIRSQIEKLREPLVAAADLVHVELLRIVSSLDLPELHQFPSLQPHVQEVAADHLRSCLAPAKKMLHSIVDCELAYINTSSAGFDGLIGVAAETAPSSASSASSPSSSSSSSSSAPPTGKGLFASFFGSGGSGGGSRSNDSDVKNDGSSRFSTNEVPRGVDGQELSAREAHQVRVIRQLLESYFASVKATLGDMGPKIIVQYLVNASKSSLSQVLVTKLYRDSLVDTLLAEDARVVARRAELERKLVALEKAAGVLQLASMSAMNASAPSGPSVAEHAAGM